MDKLRLPAEWEPCDTVLLAWPHAATDWSYMLDEVQKCFIEIVAAVSRHGNAMVVGPDRNEIHEALSRNGLVDMTRVTIVGIDTNDTWARDFGPVTLVDRDGHPTLLDFRFNGWGLKFAANHDNLVTMRLQSLGHLKGTYVNRRGFVLEGGSIESDGHGTLLTTSTCLLSPNRNDEMTRDQIGQYLKRELHVDHLLWLDHGFLEGDDTDSHVDTLARLAPGDTIIYVRCDNPSDVHYDELKAMEEELRTFRTSRGNPFNLIGLPMVDPIEDDGERLPATYANFLILNDAVLMPVYNQPANDDLAVKMMKIAFPDHTIETVDCRALIRQHGSLHCMTMQIPGQR